jgi:MFS family permease
MAISSIVIGFLPTYESIGILAVVFLIILRFIQGISYGGEESGANIIVIERYKEHQPLLILCICIMGISGVFLAKLTYFILGCFFDHQMMMDYGWRIAYIFGGIMIFHSYQARKSIAESEEFRFNKETSMYKNTIRQMIVKHKEILFLGVLSMMGVQLFWGVFVIYLPNYMALKYSSPELTSNIYYCVVFGFLFGQMIGAFLADKTNIRVAYSIGTIICMLLVIPLYISMTGRVDVDLEGFYLLLFLISLAVGTPAVLSVMQLAQRYPIKYRYTLVSTAFALSAFLFIGLPPFLFSYFTLEVSMYYPMLVFGIGCIVQLITVQLFYKNTKKFI